LKEIVTMKLIIATVPPERIEAVQIALQSNSAESIYAIQMRDLHSSTEECYRGAAYYPFRPVFRVEALVMNEMLLEETVQAVVNACKSEAATQETGTILVLDVHNWIRVSESEPRLHAVAA
jgi:nitrogen regulatory protein PII